MFFAVHGGISNNKKFTIARLSGEAYGRFRELLGEQQEEVRNRIFRNGGGLVLPDPPTAASN
jgi:hypothetical protein